MRKAVCLVIVLSSIVFGYQQKTVAQPDLFSHSSRRWDKTRTILDLCREWGGVKVVIHEDSLAMYKEWIKKTVEASKNLGYSIVISKLDNRLWLYKHGKLEKEINNIVVGPNPIDNKEMLGDGCTPEGIFYACRKNPRSSYYKAVQISYPDTTAAKKGLARRVISGVVRDQIVQATRERKAPPMGTRLGGNICIHGRRISDGCLGIGSKNMDRIFPLIEISKTPICIIRGTKEEYFISERVMLKVRRSRLFKKQHGN